MLARLMNFFRAPAGTGARVLSVLGMHRSGTSCLTGMMRDWGVVLGEVSQRNTFNAKGNQESRAIMDLHERLLVENGGSWLNPPERVEWRKRDCAELRGIIRSYAEQPCWAFKDPRTLFTIDGWREALPQLEFVGIFRHPAAVAQSLHARSPDLFPQLADGLELWARYNERLLAVHALAPFPVLSFDVPPAELREKAEALRERLGFRESVHPSSFFEEELRHQKAASEAPLPPRVAEILHRLEELAL